MSDACHPTSAGREAVGRYASGSLARGVIALQYCALLSTERVSNHWVERQLRR